MNAPPMAPKGLWLYLPRGGESPPLETSTKHNYTGFLFLSRARLFSVVETYVCKGISYHSYLIILRACVIEVSPI